MTRSPTGRLPWDKVGQGRGALSSTIRRCLPRSSNIGRSPAVPNRWKTFESTSANSRASGADVIVRKKPLFFRLRIPLNHLSKPAACHSMDTVGSMCLPNCSATKCPGKTLTNLTQENPIFYGLVLDFVNARENHMARRKGLDYQARW